MAARTPRRSFANPFVITMAAMPACMVSSGSPPPRQPQPDQTAQTEPAQTQPAATPVIVSNPPRPQPDPAPTHPLSPPPPQSVPAPTHPLNPPPPAPPAPPQVSSWHVYKTSDGCMAAIKVECPKGTGKTMPTCNPPPPFKYACPEGVSLDAPITVVTFNDTCVIQHEPIKCPPHAMCNPPRPQPVACPKP